MNLRIVHHDTDRLILASKNYCFAAASAFFGTITLFGFAGLLLTPASTRERIVGALLFLVIGLLAYLAARLPYFECCEFDRTAKTIHVLRNRLFRPSDERLLFDEVQSVDVNEDPILRFNVGQGRCVDFPSWGFVPCNSSLDPMDLRETRIVAEEVAAIARHFLGLREESDAASASPAATTFNELRNRTIASAVPAALSPRRCLRILQQDNEVLVVENKGLAWPLLLILLEVPVLIMLVLGPMLPTATLASIVFVRLFCGMSAVAVALCAVTRVYKTQYAIDRRSEKIEISRRSALRTVRNECGFAQVWDVAVRRVQSSTERSWGVAFLLYGGGRIDAVMHGLFYKEDYVRQATDELATLIREYLCLPGSPAPRDRLRASPDKPSMMAEDLVGA